MKVVLISKPFQTPDKMNLDLVYKFKRLMENLI